MDIKVAQMKPLSKTSIKPRFRPDKPDNFVFDNFPQADFLQAVIESLLYGILILTNSGEILQANSCAFRICDQLNQGTSKRDVVPSVIWKLCQALIESQSLFSEQKIILSDEIIIDKLNTFRIWVRWLNLYQFNQPILLVMIEDECELIKNVAISEARKYHFTCRETEIWSLYRAKYSYQEIAAKLCITINTVKKHMKNIHAKRHQMMTFSSI